MRQGDLDLKGGVSTALLTSRSSRSTGTVYIMEKKLMSNSLFHSSTLAVATGPMGSTTPAFSKRASSRPNREIAISTALSLVERCVMSAIMTSSLSGYLVFSGTKFASFMSTAITWASGPRLRRMVRQARPIPLPAPVKTLFVHIKIVSLG